MIESSSHCKSTRGSRAIPFKDAVLLGLAPDGGLFVPSASASDIFSGSMTQSGLPATAKTWLRNWVDGDDELFERLYPFDAPLVQLSGGDYDGILVLELFHGPTLSFKDFGARFLGAVLEETLAERSETRIVLVATSGDTGSAVADALADKQRVRVVLLYPFGMVSRVQERQLVAARPGVATLAVEGSFDDCQRLVKESFRSEFANAVGLTSANSINIARLLPQQVYYAVAAAQLGGESFNAVVPSGNLGNLAAGYLARLHGVPIQHFVAAHNDNNWFVRYLAGETNPFPDTISTLSNAMDVGAPSNAERLQYWSDRAELQGLISGYSISEAETLTTIRRVYDQTGYVADPHTAVGLAAAVKQRRIDDRPTVVLATAHPAKFVETIRDSLGFDVEVPEGLSRFETMRTSSSLVPASLKAVEEAVLKQHDLFG